MTSHICLGWKQDHCLPWLLCRSYTYSLPAFDLGHLEDLLPFQIQFPEATTLHPRLKTDAIYFALNRHPLKLLTQIVALFEL
jgi:hypothetical protein